MKKLLFLFLIISSWSSAQNIQFEDTLNFKKFLTSQTDTTVAFDEFGHPLIIDKNKDGEIDVNEANDVYKLEIKSFGVTSYKGINSFVNLKSLYLKLYLVKDLDISSLVNLSDLSLYYSEVNPDQINVNWQNIKSEKIYIWSNYPLYSIDLSQNTQLKDLEIHGRVFISDLSKYSNLETFACLESNNTSFDFTNNLKLKDIRLSMNEKLTDINISKNTNLSRVELYENQLASLDFSNNILINSLFITDSNLVSLNFSKNLNLHQIYFNTPNISDFDFSKYSKLTTLELRNNSIKSLELNNNPKLNSINIENCKLLNSINIMNGSAQILSIDTATKIKYVCADSLDLSELHNIQIDTIAKIYTNCEMYNGIGNVNKISGSIIYDSNLNGCDVNDNVNLKNIKINITKGAMELNGISNINGFYDFYLDKGNYNLSLDIENNQMFNYSPFSIPLNFTDTLVHDTTINFCITPKGIHNDLEIVLSPIGPARPGFDSKYLVTYKNKGNQTLSGDFTVEYNEDVLDLVASSLSPISTGKLGKSFADLKPFEVISTDTIVFKVNSPTATPAVNQGDTLKFIASINPIQGDETPEDNVFKFNQIVVNSHDPNLITCLQGNVLPTKEIGKTLHYTIEFENTGNYPAENIVVVETIDTTKYDINSIQILNTSHPMKLRVEGNKVEYYFQNIDLGEHKHGNILLKLHGMSTIKEGDTISKQANIYFDYNAPVETNNESTLYKDKLIQSLGVQGIALDESIVAFPNPSNGIFNLKATSQITNVEVYDLNGRVLQTILLNDFTHKIDLSSQVTGIYLLKVTTNTGANVLEIKKD